MKTITRGGRRIAFPDADDFMAAEVTATGEYQLDHYHAALEYVTDRTVAIDGGAHVGLWSRLMAETFSWVYAVEPSPDTFEALRWNLNEWRCWNVIACNVALGAEEGFVDMTADPAQLARRNTGGRWTVNGTALQQVTVDSWNLETLGLLKLDIEGGEALALTGATGTLVRCRPIVIYEEKALGVKHYGQVPALPARLLAGLGYRLLRRVGCDEIWGPT